MLTRVEVFELENTVGGLVINLSIKGDQPCCVNYIAVFKGLVAKSNRAEQRVNNGIEVVQHRVRYWSLSQHI